jgi:hypothetical protein
MAYGSVPPRRSRGSLRRTFAWSCTVAGVLALCIFGAGWVQSNWSSFDSRTDTTLCRLMEGRC